MKFTYIDGDNIGLKIECSFLENDEITLKQTNNEVTLLIKNISDYLTEKNQELIFSGADGIICKGNDIEIPLLLDYIRELNSSLTFSIGTGTSLKDSYIALRYAKSLNKNIAVELNESEFTIIDN